MNHRQLPSDKILFSGMKFYAYHGFYEEEHRLGQRFEVDAVLYLDLRKAGGSDSIGDTVNYAEVYGEVEQILQGRSRTLLESVAEETAQRLLSRFPVEAVTVRLRKPDPPIPGHYDHVAVEITRGVAR